MPASRIVVVVLSALRIRIVSPSVILSAVPVRVAVLAAEQENASAKTTIPLQSADDFRRRLCGRGKAASLIGYLACQTRNRLCERAGDIAL